MTTGGRILCIFYAFFGIPINILFLQVIGEVLLNVQQALVTRFETGCLKTEDVPKFLNEKCTLLGFLLLLVLLFIGTGIQIELEDWTFLEGFYAYFITFTTVGFGDLIPVHSTKKPGHVVIRVFMIILGLVAMSNMLNALASCQDTLQLLKKVRQRCGRRGSIQISEQNANAAIEMQENASK